MKKKVAERSADEKLASVVEIATAPGNYDASPYLHGMANGLILAQAIMAGATPEYLDAPNAWLRDAPDASTIAAAQGFGG